MQPSFYLDYPGSLLLWLALFLLAIVWITLPVQWAAAAVGARRTGTWWCLLALICASAAQTLGLGFPVAGSVVALLLSAAVFAAILDATFVQGLGIAVLHTVIWVLLCFFLLSLVAVVSLSR